MASTTIERPSGVSSAREDNCAASARVASDSAAGWVKSRRHAVAQGDAGSVEQQHIDVASRFNRTPTGRQHIALHHAIDAADADGAEQPPNRGGNQTDKQRDTDTGSVAVVGALCPAALSL